MINRLLALIALFWCVWAHAASPDFSDFNPGQFLTFRSVPPVGFYKVNLSVTPSNITYQFFYTTNLFSTNITAETINNVSNFNLFSFITNLFVTQEYVSNLFVTNITVLGQGNGPWILSLQGSGTNITINNLLVNEDFIVASTNLPPVFDLVSNNIIEAGFDGTQFFGNGGGLTNLPVASIAGVFPPPQFSTNGGVVTLTNTAGLSHMAVPHITLPGSKTNAELYNLTAKGPTVSGFSGNAPIDWFYFLSATNTFVTHAGTSISDGNFYIGVNSLQTDGTLIISPEWEGGDQQTGGPFDIAPDTLRTNMAIQDSLLIGNAPGYWLMATNATHAAIKNSILDSTVLSIGALPLCFQIQFSTIQEADGSLLQCTNINTSALIGAFFQSLKSSTNDVIISGAGNGWNSFSSANTFIGGSVIPNSTHGNSNIVIGANLDLPVDGNNNQLNIGNLIWGTGVNLLNNTRASGTLTVNNNLAIHGMTTVGVLTNDTSGNVGTAFILPSVNAAAATNVLFSSLSSPTNAVNAVTAIDFSIPEMTTNITANLAFTSLLNFSSTNYNYAIRHIINTSGGNLTLTTGTGWRTDPILRTTATTYTITNNTCVDLLVGAQINFFTNANVMVASQ